MTISMVQPLAAGNALRLFIQPPQGARRWRILRKGSDTFTGPDDPEAFVAYEGDDRVIIDSKYLQNEVMAFYRPYYTEDGGTWQAGPTAHGTPEAAYEDATTDVLTFVRNRIEAGLKVEVERGALAADLGYIQVYIAPPSLERDIRFPLVTITLETEDSNIRGIGEYIGGDEFDAIESDWDDSEGWIAKVQLTIVGWSLNSDERLELRKALRRVIVANLPVFAAEGFDQVEVDMSDNDAVSGEYGAPVYQVMVNFTCNAPVRVISKVPALEDVISTIRSN